MGRGVDQNNGYVRRPQHLESFFATLQRELLDRRQWATRKELASAIFEWIEAWYNPRRRHTSIDNLSPVDYESLFTAAADAA